MHVPDRAALAGLRLKSAENRFPQSVCSRYVQTLQLEGREECGLCRRRPLRPFARRSRRSNAAAAALGRRAGACRSACRSWMRACLARAWRSARCTSCSRAVPPSSTAPPRRCSRPACWPAGPGRCCGSRPAATLYPPALARAGLDPARMVLVRTRHGALRAMEESLRHPGLAGVVCEHEGRLDLTASRRLQLAAEAAGVLGFVLRRSQRFDDPALTAPSAAATRWRITSLLSPPPLPHAPDVPGLGPALWRLELLRCQGAAAASLVVECPDAQGRLAVPARLADGPLAPAWPRRAAGGAAPGHPCA